MGYVRTTQFCCRTRVSVGDASKSLLSALVLQIGTIVERVVTQRSAAGCHKVVVSPGPECVEANARDVYRIRHQRWSSLRKRSASWSRSFFSVCCYGVRHCRMCLPRWCTRTMRRWFGSLGRGSILWGDLAHLHVACVYIGTSSICRNCKKSRARVNVYSVCRHLHTELAVTSRTRLARVICVVVLVV